MDPVPAYLLVYLLKIRKHSGEPGYLKRRLEDKTADVATYECAMIREAVELHLVGASEEEDELVFDPSTSRFGTTDRVDVPHVFVMLARGHYAWSEVASGAGKWLLAALVGGLIAGALGH